MENVIATAEILELRESDGVWSEQWVARQLTEYLPEGDGYRYKVAGEKYWCWLPLGYVRGVQLMSEAA